MTAPIPGQPTRVRLEGLDLLIDGAPFVLLGAEVHNSSSSTPQAISRAFDKVSALGANTVLAPVAWDLWEPSEGTFDTALLDSMIAAARERGLRLVPLWFGSWKNAMSSYVPAWVKQDTDRFPRAHTTTSGRIEHLSPFAAESRDADARAFHALMNHLRDVDQQQTAVMVQVENEVGLLGDSRDRSPLAGKAFHSPVPPAVVEAIARSEHLPVHQDWLAAGSRREGSWTELLGQGPNADEAFMAHAYAAYIEHVASAGRKANDVPLYVNAWLDAPLELDLPTGLSREQPAQDTAPETAGTVALAGGQQPGTYPSGGPLPRVAPIWQTAAPTLDFLAPDIYFGDTNAICRDYTQATGRLFIPEMRRSPAGIGLMFTAIGEYGALGVAPFGVDSLPGDTPDGVALADAYRLLTAATDRTRAGARRVTGFMLDHERPTTQHSADPYTLAFDAPGPFRQSGGPAYGLVLQEERDQFLLVGRGFTTSFTAAQDVRVGILSVEELDFDGRWTVTRRLGGDETSSGASVRLHSLDASQPAFFPIPLPLASTGIVRVRLYTY